MSLLYDHGSTHCDDTKLRYQASGKGTVYIQFPLDHVMVTSVFHRQYSRRWGVWCQRRTITFLFDIKLSKPLSRGQWNTTGVKWLCQALNWHLTSSVFVVFVVLFLCLPLLLFHIIHPLAPPSNGKIKATFITWATMSDAKCHILALVDFSGGQDSQSGTGQRLLAARYWEQIQHETVCVFGKFVATLCHCSCLALIHTHCPRCTKNYFSYMWENNTIVFVTWNII